MTKKIGLVIFVLAVVFAFGVMQTNAALTVGALTITSSGALTLDGAAASAITMGSATTTGNIAIGGALTTGTLTLGKSDQTGATTIYGGSTTNAVRVIANVGAVASEAHGLDVVSVGELSSGDNLVGINSVLTPTGTAGTWASAVYGKVVQGATKTVNGYISGGEFEVADTNAAPSEVHTLVLDSNSSVFDGNSSYIWGQDFGAAKMPLLLKITGTTIGTADATKMVSTTADSAATHTVKITVNGTTLYLLATTTAPH